MKMLGITSATGVVGAAVAEETGIMAEYSISGKIAQSEKLTAIINEVLEKARIKINDIGAVAVTAGPGSYSGLRGGLATAKGLVAALDIPIIPVSTLHAIAFNLINTDGTIAIAVNACRDDYNFAMFGSHMGELKRLTADITLKIDRIAEIFSSMSGKLTLAADEGLRKRISNDNIILAEPRNVVPWAVNVARIGIEKYNKKEFGEYLTMAPSYSHKPNIREFKR
jgi:tRNA threonylcarbamoyladenosine biosynthesis protein TsaB